MNLEKAYNKWQCTDIEEKYINNIEPTQFTKSELFSFAEFYHQSKVNNGVLDDVINTCEGNCGMNYCNENGCINEKVNLGEPKKIPKDDL